KTDECLEIIRRLWREESVDFSGAFYELKGVTIAPKPVQPDLPMWIGGSSDAAIRRTARIGTGWQAGGDFAFHLRSRDAPGVGRAMDAYAKRTGRDATHVFVVGDADTVLARVGE